MSLGIFLSLVLVRLSLLPSNPAHWVQVGGGCLGEGLGDWGAWGFSLCLVSHIPREGKLGPDILLLGGLLQGLGSAGHASHNVARGLRLHTAQPTLLQGALSFLHFFLLFNVLKHEIDMVVFNDCNELDFLWINLKYFRLVSLLIIFKFEIPV